MPNLTVNTYDNDVKPSWCPGCGDYGILLAVKRALFNLQIAPHEVVVVSGIGCGSKLPDYLHAYGLMTLHGRPLPAATGVKLANPELHVLVVDGDGDAYGIGGNHFMHTCRRNPDITHIVENNQIYALTKGQYSPTTDTGHVTTTSPAGVIERRLNALAVALAAGATFIARGYAGNPKHLADLIAAGIRHPGYALIEVLQPCVTFNKVNTYNWYAERIYEVAAPATDRCDAQSLVEEWGDRIPVGILYQAPSTAFNPQRPGLQVAVAKQPVDNMPAELFAALKQEFV